MIPALAAAWRRLTALLAWHRRDPQPVPAAEPEPAEPAADTRPAEPLGHEAGSPAGDGRDDVSEPGQQATVTPDPRASRRKNP